MFTVSFWLPLPFFFFGNGLSLAHSFRMLLCIVNMLVSSPCHNVHVSLALKMLCHALPLRKTAFPFKYEDQHQQLFKQEPYILSNLMSKPFLKIVKGHRKGQLKKSLDVLLIKNNNNRIL